MLTFNFSFIRSLAVEMASTAGTTGWLRGKVKVVPSGDSLVIMGSTKAEIPPEKTITLSSLIAPRLARRGGIDESFAWESREYLRKLCIGKDVTFRVDYTVPAIGREFGSVFLGDKNVSLMVVAGGWAKLHMVCHFLDVTIHNFIVLALRAAMYASLLVIVNEETWQKL
ncbi:ribonuclease TUDOR 2-like [Camellia sinensis]|uniref:ribonuclease TUDOR 2-like n=1 Tax=Camellia sinensis TaxID=4442 RepID=UPI0010358D73|nr:ribonuclease TUDOR 2-like [Camellia sinensis]